MKVALLFLTRQELNHPHVWQRLLENTEDQFSIYIHSKEAMEDPFFKKYRIPTIVPTSYFIHVKAWQVLIREALKDEANTRFVYLSESCMPLYPLQDIYHYLIHDPNSYMRYSRPWWSRDQPREVHELPIEHRWGNAEWVILNRKHAELIANDQTIIDLIATHKHDQESYPSSLFSLENCLDEVVYRQTTYANFNRQGGPHPYQFYNYSPEEEAYIQNAKRAGCLFARKFNKEFPSEALWDVAYQRLMPPSPESKITRLQTQEEMSQANTCVLLPMVINEGFFEVGYEIGVGVGLHMERLLESTTLTKLYGVDDYKRKLYQGIPFNEEEEDVLYQYVQKRIKQLAPDADVMRISSLEMAQKVQDQSIDFIFFNPEHDTTPIQKNLEAWFPKLKSGGIMAGYQTTTHYPHLLPVIQQFFSGKQLSVEQEILEPKLWWVQLT